MADVPDLHFVVAANNACLLAWEQDALRLSGLSLGVPDTLECALLVLERWLLVPFRGGEGLWCFVAVGTEIPSDARETDFLLVL